VSRGIRNRGDFLRLDLGEIRCPAAPGVLEALRSLDDEALSSYPEPWPLQEAIARKHDVHPSQVTIIAGADEGIRWTFMTFVEEGARVLVPRPTFGAALAAAEACGAFVDRVDFPLDLEFPEEEYRKKLQTRPPRVAVLSNPDAPTGTAVSQLVVRELAALAPRSLFLLNESYVSFRGGSVLEGGPLPPNLLVLRSFSKDHGLAGLRVGYAIGDAEVISAIEVVKPSYTVAAPSLRGALAALQDPGAMPAVVQRLRQTMDQLVSELRRRELVAVATAANFVRVRLSSPLQPWAAAFAAHGVLVGTSGHVGAMAPWIRVTVANAEEASRFLDVLDLLLRQGLMGARRVEGVDGAWADETEGMA
jgi:histidinol-phosphate aminotransferase